MGGSLGTFIRNIRRWVAKGCFMLGARIGSWLFLQDELPCGSFHEHWGRAQCGLQNAITLLMAASTKGTQHFRMNILSESASCRGACFLPK